MSEQSRYLEELWRGRLGYVDSHSRARVVFYPPYHEDLDAHGFETMTRCRGEIAVGSSQLHILKQIAQDDITNEIQQSMQATEHEMLRFRTHETYVSHTNSSEFKNRNSDLVWVYPTAQNETYKARMKNVSVGQVLEAQIDSRTDGMNFGIFPHELLNRIASGELIYIFPFALISSYEFTCTRWRNSTATLTGTVNHASVGWLEQDVSGYWKEPKLRPRLAMTTTRIWSEPTAAYLDTTTDLDYWYRQLSAAMQGWNMANPLEGSVFTSND